MVASMIAVLIVVGVFVLVLAVVGAVISWENDERWWTLVAVASAALAGVSIVLLVGNGIDARRDRCENAGGTQIKATCAAVIDGDLIVIEP